MEHSFFDPLEAPPQATVIDVQGDRVTILCPLCGYHHYHSTFSKAKTEHRVAACDIHAPISHTLKAKGYSYQVGPWLTT